MKAVSFVKLSISTLVLALAGCSHYSDELSALDREMKTPPAAVMAYNTAAPQDIAPAAGGAPSMTLNQYLTHDYYDMARYENDKAYDYKASRAFTTKAVMASKGKTPMPSKISEYDVSDALVPELTTARNELIAALKTKNIPENAAALAKAQTRYDCWLDRAEEAVEETHYASCKSEFEAAMASLTTPASGDTVFQIGFMQTSAVPDEAAQKRLEYIAQLLTAPQNAPMKVGLSAPAGEIGLSRLKAVQMMLVNKGIAAERVVMIAPEAMQASAPVSENIGGTVQAVLIGVPENAAQTTTTFVPVTPQTVQ
ncbi:MAG: hypothetical protein DI551_09910 [Micavibrio aeruginosavorus]|uniref:OmpA-like domain-containing protein n=1 Tax=Micavibrio aeruginosavorus TaxID=349221 RepID=A0A2W5MTJ9_9BACT|nr:MAG: hypothetical protein DI551_09910 [Micavibrio aeruginosavorus]